MHICWTFEPFSVQGRHAPPWNQFVAYGNFLATFGRHMESNMLKATCCLWQLLGNFLSTSYFQLVESNLLPGATFAKHAFNMLLKCCPVCSCLKFHALALIIKLSSKKIICLSIEHKVQTKGNPAVVVYSNYSDLVLKVCGAACTAPPRDIS